MPDGGFNCWSVHSGSVHSSLHSTLSVIEGIHEYKKQGYKYRLKELIKAQNDSHEFILIHRLFRSHKTGNIIKSDFLKLHFPCRWFYDVLRALDYFQEAGVKWDSRMQDAVDHLIEKRSKNGKWRLDKPHPGHVHFEMEKAGEASRWITLRAMRVLNRYKKLEF